MRVIPVIDLMDGNIVHGVAGRRETYQPIASQLVDSSLPAPVADAFVQKLGATECYVADLDAIEGGTPDWNTYGQIAAAGLELWVDAGLSDVQDADQFKRLIGAGAPIKAVIAGLESIGSAELLGRLLEEVGHDRLVFSLDLRQGQPIIPNASSDWKEVTAEGIARQAIELGVRRVIVLDLAQVGIAEGVKTLELCKTLRQLDVELEIISGGGVRGVDDLWQLRQAGCNAALVASALHDERLTPQDLLEVAAW